MNTDLNRSNWSTWLPWLLLFALTGVLQVYGAYSSLRLDLPATDLRWLYTGLTCHLVHVTTRHWFYNSLALLAMAVMFHPQFNWQRFLLTYIFSAISISLGLLMFPHGLHSYAGLSGVLHGYFAMGCLLLYPRQARLAIGLGMLLLIKLVVEPFMGSIVLSHPGFIVANSAHVYGVLGGVLSWFIYSVQCRLRAA